MSEHRAECLHGAYFHFFLPSGFCPLHYGISVTILGLGLLNPLLFSTLQQNVSQNTFAYGAVMSLLS